MRTPAAVRTSKFLSPVLRHDPARIGIALHPGGWVAVSALLDALAAHGHPVRRSDLARIVATDGKGRYTLDQERDRIRVNQGHSVPVDLGLTPTTPPAVGVPRHAHPQRPRDPARRATPRSAPPRPPVPRPRPSARAAGGTRSCGWTRPPCTPTATGSSSPPTASGSPTPSPLAT